MEKLADMELRAVAPAIVILWFLPSEDMIIRFIIPILSGVAWYFIKKLITLIEKKLKTK